MNDHTAKIIEKCRADDYAAQASQAERCSQVSSPIYKRSRLDLKAGVAGDNVAVPILIVDRGRGDHRNILGIIIIRDEDKDQYKIAVKADILKGLIS